jgi:hypothetical protein
MSNFAQLVARSPATRLPMANAIETAYSFITPTVPSIIDSRGNSSDRFSPLLTIQKQ